MSKKAFLILVVSLVVFFLFACENGGDNEDGDTVDGDLEVEPGGDEDGDDLTDGDEDRNEPDGDLDSELEPDHDPESVPDGDEDDDIVDGEEEGEGEDEEMAEEEEELPPLENECDPDIRECRENADCSQCLGKFICYGINGWNSMKLFEFSGICTDGLCEMVILEDCSYDIESCFLFECNPTEGLCDWFPQNEGDPCEEEGVVGECQNGECVPSD